MGKESAQGLVWEVGAFWWVWRRGGGGVVALTRHTGWGGGGVDAKNAHPWPDLRLVWQGTQIQRKTHSCGLTITDRLHVFCMRIISWPTGHDLVES